MATGADTVMMPPQPVVAHGIYDKKQRNNKGQNYKNHNDSASCRAKRFQALRRDVAGLEGRQGVSRLPLGVEALDSALAGGLTLGRVHMLCGRPGHDAALTGFAVALLRHLLDRTDNSGPIVWCPAAMAGASGMLCADGLAALGFDPGRLLIVDSPSPGRRLAALEDILRTTGLAAVLLEYDGVQYTADGWMRLARRAQLAAEASGTTAFLTGWPVAAGGFESRWHIAPARRVVMPPEPAHRAVSAGADEANVDRVNGNQSDIDWSCVWDVALRQVRGGHPCQLHLAWNALGNRFTALPLAEPQLPLCPVPAGGAAPASHLAPPHAAAGSPVHPANLTRLAG